MRREVKVILLAVLVTLCLTPFLYVQLNKVIYADRVAEYLYDDQKYEKPDIKSIKGVWGVKLPPFYVVVLFEDEPYVEYIYMAHDGVFQAYYKITEEGIRRGITEEDLKHYVETEW